MSPNRINIKFCLKFKRGLCKYTPHVSEDTKLPIVTVSPTHETLFSSDRFAGQVRKKSKKKYLDKHFSVIFLQKIEICFCSNQHLYRNWLVESSGMCLCHQGLQSSQQLLANFCGWINNT